MENLNFVSFDAIQQYRGSAAGQSTSAAVSDPFLQIIQQMVEGSKEHEALAAQEWLTGSSEDITQEQYASAGMALLEAMGGMPALMQQLQFGALTQTGQNELLDALGQDMSSRSLSDPLAVLSSLAQAALEQSAQTAGMSETSEMPILSASYTENMTGQEEALSGQTEQGAQPPLELNGAFVQSIKAALNQRRTTGAEEEAAAQSQLDLSEARVFDNVGALRLERAPQQQPAEVAPQILAKLNENLEAGTREFTMRLKPDSLGELTIRILSKDNRMTLSIVTETKEAANLLNRELAALKQAVSPMEVEVRPAVTQEQQNQPVEQTMLRYDEQERQNRGQQRRGQQQNRQEEDGFAGTIEELLGSELVQAAHFI